MLQHPIITKAGLDTSQLTSSRVFITSARFLQQFGLMWMTGHLIGLTNPPPTSVTAVDTKHLTSRVGMIISRVSMNSARFLYPSRVAVSATAVDRVDQPPSNRCDRVD